MTLGLEQVYIVIENCKMKMIDTGNLALIIIKLEEKLEIIQDFSNLTATSL